MKRAMTFIATVLCAGAFAQPGRRGYSNAGCRWADGLPPRPRGYDGGRA